MNDLPPEDDEFYDLQEEGRPDILNMQAQKKKKKGQGSLLKNFNKKFKNKYLGQDSDDSSSGSSSEGEDEEGRTDLSMSESIVVKNTLSEEESENDE